LITHNISWFLGISVAAHMAVLLAWQSPATAPGHTGHAVYLSIIQQTGDSNKQPSPPTETPAQAALDNTVLSKPAEAPPIEVAAARAVVQDRTVYPKHTTNPQQSPSVVQPVKTTAATAAPSATIASHPVLQQEETDRHIRSSVMELITRELTYPAIARRKGWQGVVKLELHIEADGSITNLQLDETSGYSILDKAAMQCLQLASIPDAAKWLQGHAIDIVVPVEYRLLDS
jgi:protein TonB